MRALFFQKHQSCHEQALRRIRTAGEEVLFYHPHRAVACMVDDLAGNAAEEEFFAS
jgi:predicted nicotinamide N-methyase